MFEQHFSFKSCHLFSRHTIVAVRLLLLAGLGALLVPDATDPGALDGGRGGGGLRQLLGGGRRVLAEADVLQAGGSLAATRAAAEAGRGVLRVDVVGRLGRGERHAGAGARARPVLLAPKGAPARVRRGGGRGVLLGAVAGILREQVSR